MLIFRLKPVDPANPEWNGIVCKKFVDVRAADEGSARNLAAETLHIAPSRPHQGGRIQTNPWRNQSLVECEEIDDHDYGTEGPEKILDIVEL